MSSLLCTARSVVVTLRSIVHYEQSQNEYQITKNGTIPENQRESLLGTRARSFGSFNSEFFVHSFTSFSNDQAPDNITQITTATTTAQVFHTKKKERKKKLLLVVYVCHGMFLSEGVRFRHTIALFPSVQDEGE